MVNKFPLLIFSLSIMSIVRGVLLHFLVFATCRKIFSGDVGRKDQWTGREKLKGRGTTTDRNILAGLKNKSHKKVYYFTVRTCEWERAQPHRKSEAICRSFSAWRFFCTSPPLVHFFFFIRFLNTKLNIQVCLCASRCCQAILRMSNNKDKSWRPSKGTFAASYWKGAQVGNVQQISLINLQISSIYSLPSGWLVVCQPKFVLKPLNSNCDVGKLALLIMGFMSRRRLFHLCFSSFRDV